MNLKELFKTLCISPHFINIVTLLARILVAKPQSADLERLISASNLLKSPLRSSMSVSTENMYLYTYIIIPMPPLYDWNRPTCQFSNGWIAKNIVIKRTKAKQQNYFNGVFPDATQTNKHHQVENSDTDEEVVIKNKIK